MNKIILLLNTIKYLKLKQIYFRLYYFVRNRVRKAIGFKYIFVKKSNSTSLHLNSSIANNYSSCVNNEFSFLNLSKKFSDEIDWNFSDYGKLWTYNLTYFEYLKDKEDVCLIYNFIDNIERVKDGLEPFPISLRGISWIKFLSSFEIKDKKIDDSLYAQYYILLDNLEYHLLGNHLLENGFTLLFGAYYFQDEVLYAKALKILKEELDEQILDDGGHFELSPMYHQIMLFRILDCINLVKNSSYKNQELLEFLTLKAELMLGWLQSMTYRNGDIPLFSDSANGVAPTSKQIFDYASRLNIHSKSLMLNSQLKSSGYRKIEKDRYESFVDIGEVGANYIAGHAHADTFNFELRIDEKPFIVDSGLSTYETNQRRFYERSTKAHNCVEILEKNSSDVWGGFRVGNRASILNVKDNEQYIEGTHDGYKKYGILHTRSWKFKDDKITIEDSLNRDSKAIFRLHFHPNVTKEEIREKIKNVDFTLSNYYYAEEFNKTKQALVLEIEFKKSIKVDIEI